MSLNKIRGSYTDFLIEFDKVREFNESINIDDDPNELIKKKQELNNKLEVLSNLSNNLNKKLIEYCSSTIQKNKSHMIILEDVIKMFALQNDKL